MFWKKKPQKEPEAKTETKREPFTMKLLWTDGTPETVEGVIISQTIPVDIAPLLRIIFEDKHQRYVNINQLKSWEAIGAEPADLSKYSQGND